MDIPSFDELFQQIKQNFVAIGIPYGDFKSKFRYLVRLICLWIIVLSETLFLVSKISTETLIELTDLAPCTCLGILSCLKIMALAGKRENIYKLTQSLESLYTDAIQDEDKRAVLQPNAAFLVQFIKYFLILNNILITIYSFLPAFLMFFIFLKYDEIQLILPYPLYLPFEVDDWISWGLVYSFSIFTGYTCTLYFTTADVLYYVLTSQVCGNMKLITSKFKKLDTSGSELLQIVKDHQYILKLADDLEDIYSAPNLFNVLIGSIEICALGFNLMIGELKQMPGYILFLVSVLLQILMMSIFGENITAQSLNIGQAAYASNWYKMDQKSKRIILTILMRSGKPQALTAYNFSVIGYESFSKIISTSWSYFTILRTVYAPTVDKEIV